MAKDGVTIAIGIIYCCIVVLCWIFLFRMDYVSSPIPGVKMYFTTTPGGMFGFFGNCFLVPSFILYMVFFSSTEGSTSATVGFWLGLVGWGIGLYGQIGAWATNYNFNSTTVILTIFYAILIIFGSILYARNDKWLENATASSTTAPQVSVPSPVYPSNTTPGPPCSLCNRATRFIAQYNRYYCDSCKNYV